MLLVIQAEAFSTARRRFSELCFSREHRDASIFFCLLSRHLIVLFQVMFNGDQFFDYELKFSFLFLWILSLVIIKGP